MRCSICGKEVSAGEGYDTILGFVCYDCYNARNFHLCVECGRRFPRDEMIEWNGLFYCREDYFRAKQRLERILEEERKKKEKEELAKRPPLVKPGSGIPVKERRKTPLSKEEISQLIGRINGGKVERKEEKSEEKIEKEFEKKESELKQKDNIKDISEEISFLTNSISNSIDTAASFISDSLLDKDFISLSQSARKKRMDEISSILNKLLSARKGKKDKD